MIILIGEIDCREGFLVALERDYYDSIEDAMNTTIKGYLHNLQTIRDNRQLKVIPILSYHINESLQLL